MSKHNINVDSVFLDRITWSLQLTDTDKLNFLKYSSYMTISEKKELVETL